MEVVDRKIKEVAPTGTLLTRNDKRMCLQFAAIKHARPLHVPLFRINFFVAFSKYYFGAALSWPAAGLVAEVAFLHLFSLHQRHLLDGIVHPFALANLAVTVSFGFIQSF